MTRSVTGLRALRGGSGTLSAAGQFGYGQNSVSGSPVTPPHAAQPDTAGPELLSVPLPDEFDEPDVPVEPFTQLLAGSVHAATCTGTAPQSTVPTQRTIQATVAVFPNIRLLTVIMNPLALARTPQL